MMATCKVESRHCSELYFGPYHLYHKLAYFVGCIIKKLLWYALGVIKEYHKQGNKITENILKISYMAKCTVLHTKQE